MGGPFADKAEESRRSIAPPRRPAFRTAERGDYAAMRQPPALTAWRASALILGWGALDEGENQASDGRREGRGTASEKFYWRSVALSLLRNQPFGQYVQGLSPSE